MPLYLFVLRYAIIYMNCLSASMCLCDASLYPNVLFDPPLATVPERDQNFCEWDCEWTDSQMQSHASPRGSMKQFHWIVQQIPLYLWGSMTPPWSRSIPWCWRLQQVPRLTDWHSEVPVSQARLGLEQTSECVARPQPLCCQTLRRNGATTMSK